jgi:hypothetical protein
VGDKPLEGQLFALRQRCLNGRSNSRLDIILPEVLVASRPTIIKSLSSCVTSEPLSASPLTSLSQSLASLARTFPVPDTFGRSPATRLQINARHARLRIE